MKNYYNYKHQLVGRMMDGKYVRNVDPSKHFMRIYQGYGISCDIFNQLKIDGCKEIRINTGKELFKIEIDVFEKNAIEANYEDRQLFCPLKYFTKKHA
ncbi:MAG TPA: hypothetical protein PKV66_06835 [Candidatus Pelethenecus sp.]|nr:hypothetical protein [Candidatus Pelethenecus sp.]